MKRLYCLASSLLLFPALSLASDVTLYGGVDLGVLAQKTKGKGASTVVKMVSGYSYASRWGIRGVEDLGNGYKVGFILEQGFEADSGAQVTSLGGRAFGRESNLFVSGPFGKVAFGRLGTLGFFQSTGILKGNIFGTSPDNPSAFNGGRKLSFTRADNAFNYTTPSFGGFTLHAMYSNKYSGDETEKWSKNNHYYGLGAKYTNGPADGSIIFEEKDNKGTKEKAIYHITAGGSYDFKVVKPYLIYQYSHQADVNDHHAAAVGLAVPAWGGTFKGQIRYIHASDLGAQKKDNRAAHKPTKGNEWTFGLGYDYPFSKRTYLWSYAGYSTANKAWKDYDNILYTGWQVGSGLVHRF